MNKLLKRFAQIGAVTKCGALMALVAGCSHIKNPYIHPSLQSSLSVPPIAAEGILSRVILIGDAGDHARKDAFLQCLSEYAGEFPEKTAAIFLGDNVYENGVPTNAATSRNFLAASNRLHVQMQAVKPCGRNAIFIPGNHDWKAKGLTAEADLVHAQGLSFLPPPGQPGPVVHDSMPGIRLVCLDSHLIINSPSHEVKEVARQLSEAVRGAGDRAVIVAAHHPLASHGIHAGFNDWRTWLFPGANESPRLLFTDIRIPRNVLWFPLPGIYPLTRACVNSMQDLSSKEYRNYIDAMTVALSAHKPLVFASGHEHSLQILDGLASEYALVSGSGTVGNQTTVGHGADSLFAHLQPGFMVLDFLHNGKILLQVIEPSRRHSDKLIFSMWLRD